MQTADERRADFLATYAEVDISASVSFSRYGLMSYWNAVACSAAYCASVSPRNDIIEWRLQMLSEADVMGIVFG